jgi:ABC-2 type transport system ATP-binding protein
MPAILVENLVKQYGTVRAVDGATFEVNEGEIFGLLGPNGAGKTTTVEILEGLRSADNGKAAVLGKDLSKEGDAVKLEIGVALQSTSLMPLLNPFELLQLFGTFYPNPLSPQQLINRMGLQEKSTALVKTLSGGQQQRLCVALALVNNPKIVFLDEPTTGLDPQARRSLWEVVTDLRKDGKTVMLTTHYMEEAERLCDRVAIMDKGRILALDTPAKLIRNHFDERAIQFAAPEGAHHSDYADLKAVLRTAAEDNDIVLYSSNIQITLAALLERAEKTQTPLGDIHVRQATLEDVFIKLTGRSIRD